MATSYSVSNYQSGSTLIGKPSAELVKESLAVGATGAVPAYADANGVWQYVSPSDVARVKRNEYVIAVFVEKRHRNTAPRRTLSLPARLQVEGMSSVDAKTLFENAKRSVAARRGK
jgi:hypothetical protein